MTKTQATRALRDALADLYGTRNDAERVVADADLNLATIAFTEKAINNWHNILSEADKQQKVVEILAIALAEYPANAPLRQASQAYLAATGQRLPGAIVDPAGQTAYPSGQDAGQDDSAEQQTLRELLARHQRNLQLLRGKKAVYGAGEEPLSLLNQIDHEEQEIARIKAELQKR